MKKGNLLSYAFGLFQVLLTLGMFFLLSRAIHWHMVGISLSKIPLVTLFVGFCSYIFLTVLRALRFQLLGAGLSKSMDTVALVWVQNLTNNLLPARLGDGAYMFLSNRLGAIPAGQSGAAVLIVIVSDILSIFILLGIALLVTGNPFPVSSLSVCALVVIGAFVPFAALLKGAFFTKLLFARMKNAKHRYIWRKLSEFHNGLERVGHVKIFAHLFLLSICINTLSAFIGFIVLRALNIKLTFWQASVALSAHLLGYLLPVQPIGGWGVFEGTLAMGLKVYGIHVQRALDASLAFHCISYLFFAPLGLIGIVYILVKHAIVRRSKHRPSVQRN